MARRVVLERRHLIELLGARAFYDAVPAFEWLRENGLAQIGAYKISERKNCCGGSWKIAKAIVDGFFNFLKTEATAETRAQVKAYLAAKKGYAVSPVVIFYRSAKTGKPNRFEF